MDEGWREHIDELKSRTKKSEIHDFLENLADWGINNQHHVILWEAMVAIIEADEKGDFDGLLGDEE